MLTEEGLRKFIALQKVPPEFGQAEVNPRREAAARVNDL